jgi:hypothetical protein
MTELIESQLTSSGERYLMGQRFASAEIGWN